MFDRLMTWLSTDGPDAPADDGAAAARAACVLMVAAARADGEFSRDEACAIATLVSGHFGLDADETAELVAAAAAEDATDLFPAARILNETLDRRQRLDVVELLWRVVLSDGRLETRENALMHKVAHLLNLSHGDLIALKLAARGDGAGS